MTGILVVDKEAGWTSHDVVARCRAILGERRIGHAGTLDPGATGVLVLGVGRATRLLRYLSASVKEYTGEVVLGVTTTTLDDQGEVTGRFDMSGVSLDDVREAAAGLTGEINQTVPMVSAVKVGGRRLHRLAREGTEVDRPVRRVTVERLEVTSGPGPGVFTVAVRCTAGTYVRALAADLGAALGGGAHLRGLRRTRAGRFDESDARPLGQIEAALAEGASVLRPPLDALDFERVAVDAGAAAMVAHGRRLDRAELATQGEGPYAVVGPSGDLLAVYVGEAEGPWASAAVVLAPA